jgi:hypothetical protein
MDSQDQQQSLAEDWREFSLSRLKTFGHRNVGSLTVAELKDLDANWMACIREFPRIHSIEEHRLYLALEQALIFHGLQKSPKIAGRREEARQETSEQKDLSPAPRQQPKFVIPFPPLQPKTAEIVVPQLPPAPIGRRPVSQPAAREPASAEEHAPESSDDRRDETREISVVVEKSGDPQESDLQKLEFHELANKFPLLKGEDLQKIADGIKADGFLLEPITLLGGKILDGRNRYNAAKQAGCILKPEDVEQFEECYPGQDPVAFVIAKNLHRRHLSVSQRAAIAAELYAQLPKQKTGPKGDKSSIDEKAPRAQERKKQVAAAAQVGVQTLEKASQVLKEDPVLHAEVEAGKTTLHAAAKEVKKQKQQKKAAFDEAGVGQYVKDKTVLGWLRKAAEHYRVPLAKQAKVAALLLNEAVEHNKGRLSLPFAKDYEQYIASMVKHDTTQIDEQTGAQIEAEAAQEQWKLEAEKFQSHLGGIMRSGYAMTGLAQQYPQIDFVINNELRHSIKHAKQVIDKLAELKPISRWGL